jgi:hypothetical protein
MAKRREPRADWKHFIFTPDGADANAHGIKYGDDGYLHLCQRFQNGDYMRDYVVTSSVDRPELRGRNVAIDWTGFDKALRKYQSENPSKPSVFSGKYQHSEEGREVRKRLLHAACREYQHPEALVDDLWALMIQGKPDELENFIRIFSIYWHHPEQRPECRVAAARNSQ